jgi:hypothetical protein
MGDSSTNKLLGSTERPCAVLSSQALGGYLNNYSLINQMSQSF